MTAQRFSMRVGAALCAAALASCGGSPSAVNCHPSTVRACIATVANGCALATSLDGKRTLFAAACSGADARATCQPTEDLICVADCNAYDGCRAP